MNTSFTVVKDLLAQPFLRPSRNVVQCNSCMRNNKAILHEWFKLFPFFRYFAYKDCSFAGKNVYNAFANMYNRTTLYR